MENLINEKNLADQIGVTPPTVRRARNAHKLDGLYVEIGRLFFYNLSDFENIKKILSAKCRKCNSDFIKQSPGHTFCSDKCRLDYMSKNCEHCGTLFVITRGDYNRAFCSISCSRKHANAQKSYKICEYCHIEYYGAGKQRFCCKECWELDYKDREAGLI